MVHAAGREVVEGAVGHADDVALDKGRTFGRAVLRMLETAFPLEHGPAVITVLGKLRENPGEVDLPVARRTKPPGETRMPLIVQNTHRYFFWIAGIISVINTYDAIVAFQSPSGFGFGLGNVILVVNVILLWTYTLSCHSCRHIVGGRLKHFSKHPVRYWMWTQVSNLNTRHKMYAWITLGTLIVTDLYIALVASGAISDLRFIG